MSLLFDIIKSWDDEEGSVNSLDEIQEWLTFRATNLKVNIQKVNFDYKDGFWYYDTLEGRIRNRNNAFFQIAGYQEIEDEHIVSEQPIIFQPEIGFLGIICQKINGVLQFLMQAKIEPGNVNCIQLSPTIQATKSNFTRMHGGKAPAYLEYFENASRYHIIYDQIQSEQSSRFFKKRNRNIVIYVEDDIEVLESHKWMTLGQIKKLLEQDNVVNMDTRTVLSGIPFSKDLLEEEELKECEEVFRDKALFSSVFKTNSEREFVSLFNRVNDYKMFYPRIGRFVGLTSLKSWEMRQNEVVCKGPHDFKVIYCHIEIEDREVQYWEQPLVEANGMMLLGLFTRIHVGIRQFLVAIRHEIGCFDIVELGPTIQLEPTNPRQSLNHVEKLFLERAEKGFGIYRDVLQSEEGGRFYHEQNRNMIIEVGQQELQNLPEGYFWVDFHVLNRFMRYNNLLNIQLRNLLSLLHI